MFEDYDSSHATLVELWVGLGNCHIVMVERQGVGLSG